MFQLRRVLKIDLLNLAWGNGEWPHKIDRHKNPGQNLKAPWDQKSILLKNTTNNYTLPTKKQPAPLSSFYQLLKWSVKRTKNNPKNFSLNFKWHNIRATFFQTFEKLNQKVKLNRKFSVSWLKKSKTELLTPKSLVGWFDSRNILWNLHPEALKLINFVPRNPYRPQI